MSTISQRKQKRSDIEAYYRNESKTFWFGPLKIGTEAERFGLVRIFCVKSSSFPFWPIGSGTKQTNLIWSKNCRSKRFWFGLLIISTKVKHFDLVCLLSERKQNVLIWSAYYQNKSKTIWFAPKIISAEGFYMIHTYIYLSTSNFSKIKKVADSLYRWVGESPTPRFAIWSTINFKT